MIYHAMPIVRYCYFPGFIQPLHRISRHVGQCAFS